MTADNGIYIIHWFVDGQKVYSAAEATTISNLEYFRVNDYSDELIRFVNRHWGKGPFFRSMESVLNWANHLDNKRKTKHGVVDLGKMDTDPPKNIYSFLLAGSRDKPVQKEIEAEIDKFWMIHSVTGNSPTNLFLEKDLAEKEIYRLAASYPGTKFFLVETVLMVESKLHIKEM
jgi:hypothetical protein